MNICRFQIDTLIIEYLNSTKQISITDDSGTKHLIDLTAVIIGDVDSMAVTTAFLEIVGQYVTQQMGLGGGFLTRAREMQSQFEELDTSGHTDEQLEMGDAVADVPRTKREDMN